MSELELSPAMTTSQLQDQLLEKYPRDRFAVFFDVPDNVGLKAKRRADAIAVGMWGSVGHKIDGFELKVSRADWLREVKNVDKADPFVERCDRWWLVTSSPAIARLEEIPACWGWLAATPKGLRVQRPAQILPQPDGGAINRLFFIGILRKLQDYLQNHPEVERQVEKVRQRYDEQLEKRVANELENATFTHKRLAERAAEIEKECGQSILDWRAAKYMRIAKEIADFDHLSDGGLSGLEKRLEHAHNLVSNLAENIMKVRAELAAAEGK